MLPNVMSQDRIYSYPIGYLGIQFNLTEFVVSGVVLGCDLVLSNLESQNRIWCIIDKLMDQNSVGQPKN